jgi:predicted RNase H-like nuclease (RuvC/YqgF family)
MSTDGQGQPTNGDSFLMNKVAALDNRLDELEAENERKDQRIQELETELEVVKARTNLLDLVENSDEMDGMQRAVALLQHLQKKAEKEGERGRQRSAAIDKSRAEEVLHYPDIDRTTYYDIFRRCERLVGDKDVCHYDGGTGARLVLNLENGDVPAKFSTNRSGSR